ncbi:YqaJ viral recombinase family nuclease [Kribbella deserti]|uniref:YqaJ viral recombinase family protein n=1 Tax=Kribbella deserti TaxID=1926257 RepID=A0ABV6QNB1_9ACTN
MTARVGTAELVGTFKPGSDEWHAARAKGLGGSEIAAVLGLSPFESRYSLWHRKAGLIGPVAESPEMEWGTRLENAVCDKHREVHNLGSLLQPSGTYRHSERPWQIANPDRLRSDFDGHIVSLLEAKTSPFGDRWGATDTDEIPVHVRAQVMWYLDTLGLDTGHVAVLISGLDYREYVLEYDADEAQLLRDAAVEFLATLAAGTPPPIDDHEATYKAVQEMHPDIDPVSHELSTPVARAFIAARAGLDAAKAVERQAKSAVAAEMGNAHTATWNGYTIANRQARGDGTPYVVTAKNLPDLTTETEAAA